MLTAEIESIARSIIPQHEESHISVSGDYPGFSYKYSYIIGPINSFHFTSDSRNVPEMKLKTKALQNRWGINYYQNSYENNLEFQFLLSPKLADFSSMIIYNPYLLNQLILSLEIQNPLLSKSFNISSFKTRVSSFHDIDWTLNGSIIPSYNTTNQTKVDFLISSQSNILVSELSIFIKQLQLSLYLSPKRQLFSVFSRYFPNTQIALTFPFANRHLVTFIPEILIKPTSFKIIGKSNNYELSFQSLGLKYDWSNSLFILRTKSELTTKLITIEKGVSLTFRQGLSTLAYGGNIRLNEKSKDYQFFVGKTDDSRIAFKVKYGCPASSFESTLALTIGPIMLHPSFNISLDLNFKEANNS